MEHWALHLCVLHKHVGVGMCTYIHMPLYLMPSLPQSSTSGPVILRIPISQSQNWWWVDEWSPIIHEEMISDLLCQLGTRKSVGPDGILCQVFGRWNLCQRFGRIHSAGWWFRGCRGCVGWMVGLDDLKGLFQLWFCDYLDVFVYVW